MQKLAKNDVCPEEIQVRTAGGLASSALFCGLGVSALFFPSVAFIARSNSRARPPSDAAPSYRRFLSRMLIGGSFELIDATTVRNPLHQPAFAVRPLSPHVFMDLETFVSGKKSKVLIFNRLHMFEAKYRGWHRQRSRSQLITSLPRFVPFMRDSP